MDSKRIVLVTGGGTGMGKAIVERFARNGDIVYAMGRRTEPLQKLAEAYPENVRALPVDVTKSDSVRQAVEAVRSENEAVDVLVNCAGARGHVDADESLENAVAQWDEVLAVNLTGTFLMTYAFQPLLRRPGGRIIYITSLSAFAGSSRAGGEAYAAAKAGVHGMARTLVRVLAPQGITVNCVAPGFIEDTEFFGPELHEDRRRSVAAATPAGRNGKPEDVAPAVFYLASKEAGFVNGDILHVNGGQQFGR